MANEPIGREGELRRLQGFLDGRELDGPRALVLEGEAGIGKSMLFLTSLELARARGFSVLSTRPAEAERNFPLAGLGDLFEGVLDEVLPTLAPPRRRALEVALLLEEATDPLAPRALGVAVRSALELLVEAGPLLVAVDDVQWLDPSSTEALGFALRRTSAPIHVLLARRLGTPTDPTSIESALSAHSVQRVHVAPLSVGALQVVVRERLDRAFPRPTLLQIHETSGGNPFYALEVARALPDELDPTEPLPVPETLDELMTARIDALPAPSRKALVLLSALGEGDTDTLRRAGAGDAVEAAVSHGIVVRARGRLRFTHPLLASSVYHEADEATRRSAHAVLADVVPDPLERARHLALAAQGPDAESAASLDQAASVANVRGVPRVAAELGELAHRLTPDDDREGRHRRAILGAVAQIRAGDVLRARSLADETLVEATDHRSRAEALVLLSGIEAAAGNRDGAIALRREALHEAAAYPALQAAVHQWLAANVSDSEGVGVKVRHARASLELAERLDDDFLRAGALAVLAVLRFYAGEPDAVELAEQAHALATSPAVRDARPRVELAHLLAWTYDRLDLVASFTLVGILIDTDRFDTARALLDSLQQDVARRDELLESKTLWQRSLIELNAGRWRVAQELATRERDITALYQTVDWPGPYFVLAELAVHRGELDEARGLVTRGYELVAPGFLADGEANLGFVDLAGGDLGAAIAHFAAAEAAAEACGWREPAVLWWRADFAEALLALGRVGEAVELLDAWEPDATRLSRGRILADITRCRGLVAAARGDIDVALETLERAVDQVDAAADPFGHARALLALGVTRRRARQKRGAREAIEGALAGFEALGEVIWTRRARAELGRIGGRTREEGLTAAERRVASLVADGRTNREVAVALSLGERTVETHLTHIYAKLGVRTRTELARVYEPAF
jgi:DNA-binding CsgD family transcriptional regulator